MDRRRTERRQFGRRPWISAHERRQRAFNRRWAIALGIVALALGLACLGLMRWADAAPMADALAHDPRLFLAVVAGMGAFAALIVATLAASES